MFQTTNQSHVFAPHRTKWKKQVYPSEKNHLKILWYTILQGVMENHHFYHFCPSKMIVQIFSISWQLQFWFDCSFILCKMVKICVYIQENYNNSPTWIVRPFWDDSPYQPGFQVSGEQWGRYNLPIYIYIYQIYSACSKPIHPMCQRANGWSTWEKAKDPSQLAGMEQACLPVPTGAQRWALLFFGLDLEESTEGGKHPIKKHVFLHHCQHFSINQLRWGCVESIGLGDSHTKKDPFRVKTCCATRSGHLHLFANKVFPYHNEAFKKSPKFSKCGEIAQSSRILWALGGSGVQLGPGESDDQPYGLSAIPIYPLFSN